MRFPINAIAAFIVVTSSGCVASKPGETSELNQAVVQSCVVSADCFAFGDDQCLANQTGACAQAGTPSAHCVCVRVPSPNTPGNPQPVPGDTCWEIYNNCVWDCGGDDWSCRNRCDSEWGGCGF